eukprot:4716007-Prymnesium_polylepis.2
MPHGECGRSGGGGGAVRDRDTLELHACDPGPVHAKGGCGDAMRDGRPRANRSGSAAPGAIAGAHQAELLAPTVTP